MGVPETLPLREILRPPQTPGSPWLPLLTHLTGQHPRRASQGVCALLGRASPCCSCPSWSSLVHCTVTLTCRASPGCLVEGEAGQACLGEVRLPSAGRPQGEVPTGGPILRGVLPCPANPAPSPRCAHGLASMELTSLPVTIHGLHSPLGTLARTPAWPW